MRRDRAEARARELNAGKEPDAERPESFVGLCYPFHVGRNRWQVRRRLSNWDSEVVEQ